MPRTIAVIGGFVMDLITVTHRMPEIGETINATSFSTFAGGKGANSAVAAFRLSHDRPNPDHVPDDAGHSQDDGILVRMIGAVGNDSFGPACVEPLALTGVDVSGVRTIDGQTTGVGIVVVESYLNGENRILLTAGANLYLQPSDFLTLESLAGGVMPDLLITQLELSRETVEQILQTASLYEIDVLLNPAPAKYLLRHVYKKVTHLIVNETEAAELSGLDFTVQKKMAEEVDEKALSKVTDHFLDLGVKHVVVTLGSKGAYYSSGKGKGGHVEAEQDVNVVDTTGAGDTFVGTYGVEFVQQKHEGKWNIRQAVERACKASARIIEKLGAQDAIPWADEVEVQIMGEESGLPSIAAPTAIVIS